MKSITIIIIALIIIIMYILLWNSHVEGAYISWGKKEGIQTFSVHVYCG